MRSVGTVTAGSLVANALAYLVQLPAGRLLGPAGYGEFAVLLAAMLVLSVPALALQTVVAREVVRGVGTSVLWRLIAVVTAVVAVCSVGGAFAMMAIADSGAGPAFAAMAGAAPLAVIAGGQGLLQGGGRFGVLGAVLAAVGVLRDTQKYLALALPFYALAAAAAVGWLRAWVPTGFAVAAVAALIVAPLPDLAWGVGGALKPVEYPDDYARAVALIGADDRAVLLIPASGMRDFPWNNAPSLSPLPRMLDAPVIVDDTLLVDGVALDGPAAEQPLDPAALHDVGWVVWEAPRADRVDLPPPARLEFSGDHLAVYRLPDAPAHPAPGAAAWTTAAIAHALWFGCLLGLFAPLARRGQRARAGR